MLVKHIAQYSDHKKFFSKFNEFTDHSRSDGHCSILRHWFVHAGFYENVGGVVEDRIYAG